MIPQDTCHGVQKGSYMCGGGPAPPPETCCTRVSHPPEQLDQAGACAEAGNRACAPFPQRACTPSPPRIISAYASMAISSHGSTDVLAVRRPKPTLGPKSRFRPIRPVWSDKVNRGQSVGSVLGGSTGWGANARHASLACMHPA